MATSGMSAVQKYAQRTNFPHVVHPDLLATIEQLNKTSGATQFGIVGFCWGGKIVIQALGSPDLVSKGLKAAASLHPSMLDTEDAEKCNGAVCLLPSKDEPEIVSGEFWEKIKGKKGVGERSVHKRFADMFHGYVFFRAQRETCRSSVLGLTPTGRAPFFVNRWCQTRGNFSDPTNKERAEEAIAMTAEFFKKELVGSPSL